MMQPVLHLFSTWRDGGIVLSSICRCRFCDVVLSDQERSSEKCTSRNLVLLILSAAARLTVSYQNIFNFLYIQEEIVFSPLTRRLTLFLGLASWLLAMAYHSHVICILNNVVGAIGWLGYCCFAFLIPQDRLALVITSPAVSLDCEPPLSNMASGQW